MILIRIESTRDISKILEYLAGIEYETVARSPKICYASKESAKLSDVKEDLLDAMEAAGIRGNLKFNYGTASATVTRQ